MRGKKKRRVHRVTGGHISNQGKGRNTAYPHHKATTTRKSKKGVMPSWKQKGWVALTKKRKVAYRREGGGSEED